MQPAFYWNIVQQIGGRYFMVAGAAFFIAYVLLRKQLTPSKIQLRYPQAKDYVREIGFSLLTIGIFACIPLLLIKNDSVRPYTRYYRDIGQYGRLYFGLAFLVMLFLHDTYFYWIHRLMHHPKLFTLFHLVHHRSTNPSPWAAYAFHPLEAILEGGIVALFLFTMPMHRYHLSFFFFFMIVYNVYGHLGWEIFPKGIQRHWLGKWINTGIHHNHHHQYFKGNYGLYFLFWDRWMGTLR